MGKKLGSGTKQKRSVPCNGSGFRHPDENDVSKTDRLMKLRTRALLFAKIKNVRIAHDFLDWLTLEWLEGKRQHQTIDQSYIDFLRTFHGVERGDDIQARKEEKEKRISKKPITPVRSLNERFIGGWIEEGLNLKRNPKRDVSNEVVLKNLPDLQEENRISIRERNAEIEIFISKIHRHLNEREILLIRLATQWKFNGAELAKLFGIHETRITQIMNDLILKIENLKRHYKLKP